MAGGELRLGTTEMYMRTYNHNYYHLSSTNMFTTWEHFHSPKLGFRSNKSETYLKIQADFFSNFGLVAADAFRPHRLSPLGCRIPDAAAFDKASGSLFLHFAVLKAWRQLGAKPLRERQSKCLRN